MDDAQARARFDQLSERVAEIMRMNAGETSREELEQLSRQLDELQRWAERHRRRPALVDVSEEWWEQMATRYLQWLARRGRSDGTVRAYQWGLRDFGRWLAGAGVDDPEDLAIAHVEAWQDEQLQRGLAPRTRQLSANAIRTVLRWGKRNGYDLDPAIADAIVTPKAPHLMPRPLEPHHVDKINAFLAPRRPRAPLIYWRTRALWYFAVCTGARTAEILCLDREDFEQEELIVRQKGGSEKLLLAPPVAMTAVDDYLSRRTDQHAACFVTHGDPPVWRLGPPGMREGWHRLADQLQIPRFSSHQLRHTCASTLLEMGIPPDVVAEHLGHHGLATVMGYAKVSQRRRQGAVSQLEGRFGRFRVIPGDLA